MFLLPLRGYPLKRYTREKKDISWLPISLFLDSGGGGAGSENTHFL